MTHDDLLDFHLLLGRRTTPGSAELEADVRRPEQPVHR